MPWKSELKIKDLISAEDVIPGRAWELGVEVAWRIKRRDVFTPDVGEELFERFRSVGNQEEFNDALELLYDAADNERVWVA